MLSLHHGHQKCLRLWWSGGAQAWKAEEEDVLLNPRAYVRYGRRLPPIPFILMLLHCIAAKIGKRLRVCKVAQKQDSNISTPLKSRAYHMPFQFSKVPTATPRFIVVVIADTITKKQIGRQYEKDWRGAIFIVHRMQCRGHFVQRNLSSTESPVQLMIFIYFFFRFSFIVPWTRALTFLKWVFSVAQVSVKSKSRHNKLKCHLQAFQLPCPLGKELKHCLKKYCSWRDKWKELVCILCQAAGLSFLLFALV